MCSVCGSRLHPKALCQQPSPCSGKQRAVDQHFQLVLEERRPDEITRLHVDKPLYVVRTRCGTSDVGVDEHKAGKKSKPRAKVHLAHRRQDGVEHHRQQQPANKLSGKEPPLDVPAFILVRHVAHVVHHPALAFVDPLAHLEYQRAGNSIGAAFDRVAASNRSNESRHTRREQQAEHRRLIAALRAAIDAFFVRRDLARLAVGPQADPLLRARVFEHFVARTTRYFREYPGLSERGETTIAVAARAWQGALFAVLDWAVDQPRLSESELAAVADTLVRWNIAALNAAT